ncbi:MAG: TIGR01212 family radical SAM protein [Lachnospiraceae bacterium]|nr:TIGR01212 family radical SAM protein [Lachnospiraceae bacterium]
MKLIGDRLKEEYGTKVYKVSLDGGFTCPNRDGTLGTRGCIFCSAGGSGDFAESRKLSVTEQIEAGKGRVASKVKDGKYIAYFQAYTGTYAPVDRLRSLFTEAIDHPDVVALSVATRPDCLPEDVLDLLSELNRIKPVWVELGLQTIHEKTAEYIRRGYPLEVYDREVKELRARDIEVITHVILGLPGESKEDMLDTVRHVCSSGATGIKLQLLHILKGTDLETEYLKGRVTPLTEDEYIDLLRSCKPLIPDNVTVHRLTGDGDKKLLIAPKWSEDKKHVWNRIQKEVLK